MPEKPNIDRLVFVFNADSGTLNAAIDSAKKLLFINDCALCSITHGMLGEKSEWKSCKAEIGVPVDYVHRDEMDDELRATVGDHFPSVVAEASGKLHLLLKPDVLKRCRGNVNDLRGRIRIHAAMHNLKLPELEAA